jgi:phosphoglycolate phosphatase
MVGDSLHDLQAGRAAGLRCVAVLTGIAGRADLAPHAEAVLDHVGLLPDWLDGLDGLDGPDRPDRPAPGEARRRGT